MADSSGPTRTQIAVAAGVVVGGVYLYRTIRDAAPGVPPNPITATLGEQISQAITLAVRAGTVDRTEALKALLQTQKVADAVTELISEISTATSVTSFGVGGVNPVGAYLDGLKSKIAVQVTIATHTTIAQPRVALVSTLVPTLTLCREATDYVASLYDVLSDFATLVGAKLDGVGAAVVTLINVLTSLVHALAGVIKIVPWIGGGLLLWYLLRRKRKNA